MTSTRAKEEPKKVVRRYLEEVVSTGNLDRVPEFVAAVEVESTREHIRAVRNTYPDLRITIVSQISQNDIVATRLVGRGTHMGEFFGIKPTGKAISIEAVNIDRVRDGKIVEHWGAANTLEALIEIGALRVRPK